MAFSSLVKQSSRYPATDSILSGQPIACEGPEAAHFPSTSGPSLRQPSSAQLAL